MRDEPGLLILARVSTLEDVVRAQALLKRILSSKRFVLVTSSNDLVTDVAKRTDLVQYKSVVVNTGSDCGGCILEHLVCPNQNFEFGHHIWRSHGKLRLTSIFDWHLSCPNFFHGKTLNIAFVLANPIMMRKADGTASGTDPVIKVSLKAIY